ncbi:hypothetical protein V7094_27760 [Priestia megaterium]|uniref:hypothetical protein n=1 Tax=Priestia megaterium TaxID=1404 RepID=UPI002FFD9CEF
MKGTIRLDIEIDYKTMLDQANQGALYLYTGATSVDEMIKLHMDSLSAKLVEVLKDKPLIGYKLDGKLIREVVEDPNVINAEATEVIEAPAEEVQEFVDTTLEMVNALNTDIDTISVDSGIPQSIKVNEKMLVAIKKVSGIEADTNVDSYRGFPLVLEGMDTPYIIVYKAYSGSEIKLFEATV